MSGDPGEAPDIVPNAGNLLNDVISSAGGVQNLLARFDRAGLGSPMRSWIGDGENQPVTAADIERVIPPPELDALGGRHGFPPGTVSSILAHLLPHAVDAASVPAA